MAKQSREEQFLEHYLASGNVREAARLAGYDLGEAYALRDRAMDDEATRTRRDSLRKHVLPDVEIIAYDQIQRLADEINNTPPPSALANFLRAQAGLPPLRDGRQPMIGNLAKLFKTVEASRRTSSQMQEDAGARPVTINIHPTARAAELDAKKKTGT